MRVRHVAVRGYRSLRNVDVPLADLTSLIGPNGSGKSSVLGALRLFFQPREDVGELDFWRGSRNDVEDEISIKVTWRELDDDERDAYQGYLNQHDELVVERRFEQPGAGHYIANRMAVPAFTTIRRLDRSHRQEYDKLVKSGDFPGLPLVRNREQVMSAMADWEADNPDRCEMQEVDFDLVDEVLGSLAFLYIGAFEDPAMHLDAGSHGAIGRLIERVVDRTAVDDELQAVADNASAQSLEVVEAAKKRLSSFTKSIDDSVSSFVPGCRVRLAWESPIIRTPSPRLSVSIETPDGLDLPLEYQGHGVQRSLMYAALTAEAERSHEGEEGDTLLIVEEPEAFQHPLSCRVLSRTLKSLSMKAYQIVYSTHSSEFVNVDSVAGLRIVQRLDIDGAGASTRVRAISELMLLDQWRTVFGGAEYTVESVKARLAAHLSNAALEGLFSDYCMLVEGDEDVALVRGAAARYDLDLDASGIAVIPTNGKTSMPNVLAFLMLAGVRCYPVFDLDRQLDRKDQHREAEEQILKALDHDDGLVVGVNRQYACWQDNLGSAVASDLGPDYGEMLNAAAAKYGYARAAQAKKATVVIEQVLSLAAGASIESDTLKQIAGVLVGMIPES